MNFLKKAKFIVIFLFAISLAACFISRKKNKTLVKSIRLLQKNCSLEDPSDTIFVVLPCSRNKSDECVRSLENLLHKAACPYRIRVGLWEEEEHKKYQKRNINNRSNSLVRYSIRAQQKYGKDFSEMVRFYTCPSRKFLGAASARRNSITKLYKGEKFVLLLEPGIYMIQDWDKKLVRWGKVLGKDTILTGAPSHSQGEYKYIYSARFYIAKNFHTKSELSLSTRTFYKTPSEPNISLLFANPKLTFAFSHFILDAYKSEYIDGCINGEAAYLSAKLWNPTRTFLHFPSTIAWGSPQINDSSKVLKGSHKHTQALNLLEQTFAKNPLFSEFCGVDFLNQQLNARAVMGVTPDVSEVEIMHKYGSWTRFSEIINQVMTDG